MTMSNSTINVLTLFSIYLTYSLNVLCAPPPITIAEEILNSKCTCDTFNTFINQSTYMEKCRNTPFPQRNIEHVNIYNFNIFLCIGIYDAICKTCQLGTFNAKSNTNDLSNIDTQINNSIFPVNNIQGFCTDFKKNMYNVPESVKPVVKKFEEILNNKASCELLCLEKDNKANVLCTVLYWLYKYINTSVNNSTMLGMQLINHTSIKLNKQAENENKNNDGVKNTILNPENEAETKDNSETESVQPLLQVVDGNTEEAGVNSVVIIYPKTLENTKVLKFTKTPADLNKQVPETKKQEGKPNSEMHIEPNKSETIGKQLNKNVDGNVDEKSDKNQIPKPESKSVKTENGPDVILENKPDIQPGGEEFVKIDSNKQFSDKKKETEAEKVEPPLSDNTDDHENPEDYNQGDNDQAQIEDVDSFNENGKNQDSSFDQPIYRGGNGEEEESHMFLYFTLTSLCFIVLYIGYLSKQKILATFAKVRRSRNRNRRRPSTANYRKLDCTLEEAVTSQCNANVTHVIY